METEEWRDIPAFKGIYQASNTGKIRTCEGKTTESIRHGIRTWVQRELKQKYQKRERSNGENKKDARVTLYKGKKAYTFLVSRLVASAWCPGKKDGLTVNHIDGDPTNNCAENLEWIPLKENIRKGFETGLYGSSCVHCTLVDKSGEKHEFDSMSQACVFLGRNPGYISDKKRKGKAAAYGINGEEYTIWVS